LVIHPSNNQIHSVFLIGKKIIKISPTVSWMTMKLFIHKFFCNSEIAMVGPIVVIIKLLNVFRLIHRLSAHL
jgi:hypothetical protein